MKNTPHFHKKINIMFCILFVILLAACSSSEPTQEIAEEIPAEIDTPELSPENDVNAELPQETEPSDEIDSSEASEVVFVEDLVYPGSEFLFEVNGFGGEMTPWRFYAVYNEDNQNIAEYYMQRLNAFVVENDEIIDGIRYLMLAHPEPMKFMNEVDDIDEMQEISESMDGSLLGLEVSHSDVGYGLNRLGMALEMYDIADQIPSNTTIIILEYYKNPY